MTVTNLKHDKGGLCLTTLPACLIHTSCKCLYFHSFLCKRQVLCIKGMFTSGMLDIYFAH